METLKNKWKDIPLRCFLILTVCFSIGIAAFMSALIIGGCAAFRHWLLPDADAAYLTLEQTLSDGSVIHSTYLVKYGDNLSSLPSLKIVSDGVPIKRDVQQTRCSIEKIESGIESLSPKRKFAYRLCGITMLAAPIVLSFTAILWCSMYFYHLKLKRPLKLLANATNQISEQNLDFEISYHCNDEMGNLCHSFEVMRSALYDNYKTMWNMLEERRLMQASIAHDLRNPIAIIEGYSEYLEAGLKNGSISSKKATHIAQNLGAAAKRLEQYTKSVRLLNQSEETPLDRKSVSTINFAADIAEDLSLLSKQNGIDLQVTSHLPDKVIQVDSALLYRVLENIINNALRYSRQKIELDFSLQDRMLMITITDDGDGFSSEILNRRESKLLLAGKDGHMGIGLSVSRILCRKHGGNLRMSNTSGGACVEISFSV